MSVSNNCGSISKIIWIVDDDELNVFITKKMLEKNFHNLGVIKVFSHGAEALEGLLNGRQMPDLILLDLLMPVMNGFEFIEKIGEMEIPLSFPIVVTSALERYVDMNETMSLPTVAGFLSKPLSASKIAELNMYIETWKRDVEQEIS